MKRARDALLGDKENVPKLPGANNILDKIHNQKHSNDKIEKKAQYYDEKHADSDSEQSVTVESVEESDEEESGDENYLENGSPHETV